MKKHELVKITQKFGDSVTVKLDEDEGTYYVETEEYDIVALTRREVDKGSERYVDVWVIYRRDNGIRDSHYIEKFDSIEEAIQSVLKLV